MTQNSSASAGWFDQEKNWRMLCHLSALAGLLFPNGNVLGPLIVWAVKKDQIPFVNDQAKESLNFQISLTIYAIAAGIFSIVLIGIPVLLAIFIVGLIEVIKASSLAEKGQPYRYPLTIRFVK